MSAAYYALFHLLIAESAALLSPSQPSELQLAVRRAFNHGQMREVCRGLVEGNAGQPGNKRIPQTTRALLQLPLEPNLVTVLQAFVELQDARNSADYDTAKQWNRLEVLNHFQTAKQAFANWAKIRKTRNATILLSALLLQKHWDRSP